MYISVKNIHNKKTMPYKRLNFLMDVPSYSSCCDPVTLAGMKEVFDESSFAVALIKKS